MLEEMQIKKKIYKLLNQRAYKPVSVYKGTGEFLRIGPADIISGEVKLQERLLDLNFPVARIKSTGKAEEQSYFIEESLGQKHFGQIFAEDMQEYRKISDKNFSKFLKICLKFAAAQMKARDLPQRNKFRIGIHIPEMLEELPGLFKETSRAFELIFKNTSQLPYVMTHGDFGPFNIYPKGVIDLESFFVAPIGYDLVSAIVHTDFFPRKAGFEYRQHFHFTKEQKHKYFFEMDKLFLKNGLPKLSGFINEFTIARCIWTAARMDRWPKIQQWRYKQYQELLKEFLMSS